MVRKAEDDDGEDAKEVLAAEEDRKTLKREMRIVPPPKKFEDAWSMTRSDLGVILRRLAFKLTDEELTRLVDTFDLDGDGTVGVDEFLAFTGHKRAKCAGDAVAQLRTVCSWETVCHVTGMQNAYQVVVHDTRSNVFSSRTTESCCSSRISSASSGSPTHPLRCRATRSLRTCASCGA